MKKTAPLICMAIFSGGQQIPTIQALPLQGTNVISSISHSNSVKTQTLFFESESNSKLEEKKIVLNNKQEEMDDSTIHVAYYINGDKMNSMMINEIPYYDKLLVFKNKYLMNYGIEDGFYFLTDDDLGISCYGKSYEDLYEDVKDNISANWEMYVDCDINELSSDAIDLRYKLLSNLELKS